MSPDEQACDWVERHALVIAPVASGRAIGYLSFPDRPWDNRVQLAPVGGPIGGLTTAGSYWPPVRNCWEAMGTDS